MVIKIVYVLDVKTPKIWNRWPMYRVCFSYDILAIKLSEKKVSQPD